MSSLDELRSLVDLPVDDDGQLAFREPWEAQIFALTLGLHDGGRFTWREWAECLGAELSMHGAEDGDHARDHYFDHWAAALKRIIADKGLLSDADMERRSAEMIRNGPTAHQHKARREPVCID